MMVLKQAVKSTVISSLKPVNSSSKPVNSVVVMMLSAVVMMLGRGILVWGENRVKNTKGIRDNQKYFDCHTCAQ